MIFIIRYVIKTNKYIIEQIRKKQKRKQIANDEKDIISINIFDGKKKFTCPKK